MEYLDKIKDYFTNRGTKKNLQDMISIFLIGTILVISANFFMSSGLKRGSTSVGLSNVKSNNEGSQNSSLSYEESLKMELENLLCKIEGAGKVNVMIYFESGNEVIPAFSQNDSTKVTEENDGNGGKRITNESSNANTIVNTNESGANRPFILKELKPKVSGVIVVAEGANNPEVKYKLYEAVKTLFNMQQYKVNIYPMQNNK